MTDYSELVKALRETATFTKFDDLLSKREQKLESLAFDAAAAIEELRKVNRELREMYEDAVRKLPNRGEWIKHPEVKNIYGGVYIECPFCGEKYVVQNVSDEKFCRNCGADMRAKMEVQE